MNNGLVKYARFEGGKVIIIPTADGIKLFKDKPPKLVWEGNPSGLLMKEDEETVAGQKVVSFTAELGSPIQYYQHEVSTILNYNKFRFYTGSNVNYFLTLEYQLRDASF